MDTSKCNGKWDVVTLPREERKEKRLHHIDRVEGKASLTRNLWSLVASHVGMPPMFLVLVWSESNLAGELNLKTPSGNMHSELAVSNANFL